MNNDKSVCVLVSGGLDSVALIGWLSRTYSAVYPVYIRQGLSWEKSELYWLRRFLHAVRWCKAIMPLTVFNLPMDDVYGKHWSLGHAAVPGALSMDETVYLPGRNPILTIKAAIYCAQKGITDIALGSLNHNPFPDATQAFFRLWSKALTMALGKKVRILAPFRRWSKEQVIRNARQWPLHVSFSCLAPKGYKHCGQCNKCAERRKAFRHAHVTDATRYVD